MGVHFDVELDFGPVEQILEDRGLNPMGLVQRYIDSEVIRYCDPKVPFRTGMLKDSALISTVIGSGMVVYATPYARYMFMGEVMGPNIPIRDSGTGAITGWRSPPGKPKYLTGRQINYNGAPERGAHWVERMAAEHLDDIVRGAAILAGGTAG